MHPTNRQLVTLVLILVGCGGGGNGGGAGTAILPDDLAGGDGAPCTEDFQCASGRCTEGACARSGCAAGIPCDPVSVCTVDPRHSSWTCAAPCATDDDCADGLACLTSYDVAACLPPPAGAPMMGGPPTFPAEPTPLITLECQPAFGPITVDFDIDDEVTSYVATPFTLDGSSLAVRDINLPSGDTPRVGGTLSGIGAALLGFANPILVPFPGVQIPLQSGAHAPTVSASAQDLCLLVVRQRGVPTSPQLLINLFTIGVDVDPQDSDLQVVLDTVRSAYDGAGIEPIIQQIVALNAPALEVIDDLSEIDEAVALTTVPPAPLEALSINVVFTADFDIPGSGTIGVSSGIPGPPALHGSGASGVVMTAEFLRLGAAGDPQAGARLTGGVMAHEMGHFLGLFHTTESDGMTTDAIADSPDCVNQDFGPACDDFTNLMFPSASLAATELTPGQEAVLLSNPSRSTLEGDGPRSRALGSGLRCTFAARAPPGSDLSAQRHPSAPAAG